MDPVGLLIFLAVGAVAGWLAGRIFRGGGYGIVVNMLIGVAGAVIAGHLFPGLLPIPGLPGAILSAALGALLLLFLLSLLRR